jgi:hypothetical protein
MNERLPSTPPQNVSADIPIIMRSGSAVMTSRTAVEIDRRICPRRASKLSSESSAGFSMYIRPVWKVTPCGRSAFTSCSTTVLVEGTITPTLAR